MWASLATATISDLAGAINRDKDGKTDIATWI